MRLLKFDERGELSLTEDLVDSIPPYAILSHTWGADKDEVTFEELRNGPDKSKAGYRKIEFCGRQARKDKLDHFWVDTCCINKANHAELSEAIISMFRWYSQADRCYVYLSDVPDKPDDRSPDQDTWESAFRNSKWFTRGWTLQELLAPRSIEFFSREGKLLGSKKTFEGLVHEITQIPIPALWMANLSSFSVDERLRWVAKRTTKRLEDQAYCLLGIFGVFMPPMYGEGDNAWRRLKDKIVKRSGSSLSAVHTHWMVARPRNSLFTGRDDILQELDITIRDAVYSYTHQTQCRIVITGIGGQGKSEICLQLAHRLRQTFWGVFWIDVSTTSLAERAFLDIAHKLTLPAQTWEDAYLGVANLRHPWLLVLDNADDPAMDYQQYFPDSPLGVVMLTSRNDECHQYATTKPIILEGLAHKEARYLLLKAAHVSPDRYDVFDQDAQLVASLLQSHPLALTQAGAYVSRGHCTLSDYPRIYEQQQQELLTFRPAQARSRYRDVYATFEVSANALKSSAIAAADDALQLLPLLAVCGSSRLPLPMFEAGWRGAKTIPADRENDAEDDVLLLTSWHVVHLPLLSRVGHDTWNSYRLVEAVQQLRAFALVSTDFEAGHLSVSMHPLVHAWARDRQGNTERHQSWLQMGCLMAVGSEDAVVWQQHERQLRSHIEALVGWKAETMFGEEPVVMVARTLVNCGWLLRRMRSDFQLFILMEKIFTHMQLDEQTIKHGWAGLYDLKGRNLVDSGKVRSAVPMLEAVVKIHKQSLAEDHPSRLASQHELAGAYEANGQVKEAVALLERVVKIQEQSLVEDHRSRLTSQHALAGAYEANGQVKEAVALLERVVKIREQSVAEDHPGRLASQHELAGVYHVNGQVKEAVALLERVVKIREQSLAEDHPDRLASQHELARAYEANGQVKEAVALLERVVKIQEQSLVEDHPSRLTSQHALAGAYEANGQVKEAVALLERVVKIEEQSVAEDHPDRLASLHALAGAYHANGQVKEAVALLERVVKIREQSLAEDHPDRLASQHNIAVYFWELGNHKPALDLMARVVQVQKQVLDEEHPDRQTSEGWLIFFENETTQSVTT